MVMVHAENAGCIAWLTDRLEARGETAPIFHVASRSKVVERGAPHRPIAFSELVDVPTLIVHVSGAEAMEEIRRAQARGLRLHAETCPQYLFLSTEDLAGRRAASRLFEAPELPTAIVCTGDILALAVVAECRRHGLAVPSDVSIVGCGDTEMGHYVDPPLTTVHMPFAEMGTEAATLLLGLLAGKPAEAALRILHHELVERSSVARRAGSIG